ncbi:hypothetical protein J5N97_005679 [Dioscorea zingiberensis]|uniref:WRKY domain-containing protein n=1 Tax=Dioscorea zingiberensis TaxID=325984 RepID=A0A9D5DAP4_9LILI|nr:hypothetical protein J5N97_005679 [Dioscorea zingiberensis]
MEDIANQILHGCRLAGELKENLHNLVNQSHHHLLISSCEEVAKTFTEAIQKLSTKEEGSSSHGFTDMESAGGACYEETQPEQLEKEMCLSEQGLGSLETIIRRGEPSTDAVIKVGTSEEASEVASFRISSEKRKRIETKDIHTVLVPCHPVSEGPPDDGYSWRKYAQKEIPGSKFPRSYYCCAHRINYGCSARKRVQRLDSDPTTCQIDYFGTHSCTSGSTHTHSCTSGALLKISSTYVEQKLQGESPAPCPTSPSLSTSIQLGSWFSGELECSRTDAVACPKPRTGNEVDVSHDGDSSGSSVHAISR